MIKYKSTTQNRGTTIILDSLDQAIEIGRTWKGKRYEYSMFYDTSTSYEECVKAIKQGDNTFKEKVEEIIDDLLDVVDALTPKFSMAHQGFELTDTEGVTAAPDLVSQGQENCILKKKKVPFKIKRGTGDGAYRLIINTDVSWFGKPEDNCALVGALIVLLQRYAPVELYVQQAWLGPSEKDGVTLFKLEYPLGLDICQLAFWITHVGKDIPFSYNINRALGRVSNGTAKFAEIEVDLHLRGDWLRVIGVSYDTLSKALYTEKIDIMSKWVSQMGMKILEDTTGPQIIE